MLILLIAFMVGALSAPILLNKGRLGLPLLAAIPAAAFAVIFMQRDRVIAGKFPEEVFSWAPQLGFELTFKLDELSWVMALIVTGVGAMVLIYSGRYFSASAHGLGRFAGVFMAFAGAMLGLVTTDNTLAMYMFWELTTVFSFLLIGHNHEKSASRQAAMQAIIVTTFGGLAMLAGIITLGQIPGGSYSFTELVAAAQDGSLGVAPILAESTPSWIITTAVVLILAGALSKSALIPFHFWLPAAMAAPTPVSAYLHAAAMVKAGVYLVARLAPAFSGLAAWRWIIMVAGIGTLLLGGYRALRQNDLKLVLAFGTVSQLGLIMLVVGYGTRATLLAGLALLVAHALYKSTLFLSVGLVDWAAGTRDLRKLSGMWREMPFAALAAALATASMMGLPPFIGFVAKEAALHALIGGDVRDTITWVAIAIGSALTVGYALRFWWGAFATKKGIEKLPIKDRSWIMVLPVLVLAAGGIVVGLQSAALEKVLAAYVFPMPGESGHLAIWSGVGPALYVTGVVLVVGILIFLARGPWVRATARMEFPLAADSVYRRMISGLGNVSGRTTALTQRGSLPAYLSTMFVFVLAVAGLALLLGDIGILPKLRLFDSPAQAAVVVVTCLAAILAARSRHRTKAVLLMGVSGYGVAFTYELYGAPDLALTQTLAETVTLVVFVLVLRRLPPYFSNRPLRVTRWWRLVLAVSVGLGSAALAWLAGAARTAEPISKQFHDEAYSYGYGKNIVNVTLVDIRAWDTFGEIAVVVVCAVGVSSLLFIRDKGARVDRFRNLAVPSKKATTVWNRSSDDKREVELRKHNIERGDDPSVRAPGRGRVWLAAQDTLAVQRRSVILEVGTRLIFHTLLILSLFFLFSGHNQPGGGFAGGLLVGIALILRYIAGGRYELGAAMPLHPGHLMGAGLSVAGIAAVTPVFFGGTIFQSARLDFAVPGFGEVHMTTALFFDIGVYLVVIGLVLDILRSLGAEIDRHGEIEGVEEDDSLHFTPRDDARRDIQEAVRSKVTVDANAGSSSPVPATGREPSAASSATAESGPSPQVEVDPTSTGTLQRIETIAIDPESMTPVGGNQ